VRPVRASRRGARASWGRPLPRDVHFLTPRARRLRCVLCLGGGRLGGLCSGVDRLGAGDLALARVGLEMEEELVRLGAWRSSPRLWPTARARGDRGAAWPGAVRFLRPVSDPTAPPVFFWFSRPCAWCCGVLSAPPAASLRRRPSCARLATSASPPRLSHGRPRRTSCASFARSSRRELPPNPWGGGRRVPRWHGGRRGDGGAGTGGALRPLPRRGSRFSGGPPVVAASGSSLFCMGPPPPASSGGGTTGGATCSPRGYAAAADRG